MDARRSAPADTEAFIEKVRGDVEAGLSEALQAPPGAPERLVEALRYAVLGAGKRFRPILVMAAGEAGAPTAPSAAVVSRLLAAACAVEMIHTFSLIHDDLPALDDDTMRRGRPTLHVKFDEATAILAGDALLNLAYEMLASGAGDPATALAAIAALGRAVGLRGMISGQVLDLEAEGAPPDAAGLHLIHSLKTGSLITACCEVGGLIAGAGEGTLSRLVEYGGHLGLAFQIVDDILDVEGSASEIGKSPGKDARASKATFPAMWGIEGSRRRAREAAGAARAAVSPLGEKARHLTALADLVLTRRR
jgi:geranylgeranyl pyrophosphate synthase